MSKETITITPNSIEINKPAPTPLNEKRLLLIAVAHEELVEENMLEDNIVDMYGVTNYDYVQMFLYDCDTERIIFDEDTGHESPWAHLDYIIEGLQLDNVNVYVSYGVYAVNHDNFVRGDEIIKAINEFKILEAE